MTESLRPSSLSRTKGIVASLHVHPAQSGEPLLGAETFHLVAQKGIQEDVRYFGRVSRVTRQPNRRQLTLIEREQIAEHAAVLGLPVLPPGVVRSNIETTGIDLAILIGRQVEIGTALVHFYELRQPCQQMDDIAPGLRQLMNDRQGVLAEVLRSGVVRVGDTLRVVEVTNAG